MEQEEQDSKYWFRRHQYYYSVSVPYSTIVDVSSGFVPGITDDEIISLHKILDTGWKLLDDDQRLCLWNNKPDIVKRVKFDDIVEQNMYELMGE